jgi:hypothetical protein
LSRFAAWRSLSTKMTNDEIMTKQKNTKNILIGPRSVVQNPSSFITF